MFIVIRLLLEIGTEVMTWNGNVFMVMFFAFLLLFFNIKKHPVVLYLANFLLGHLVLSKLGILGLQNCEYMGDFWALFKNEDEPT